MIEPEAVILDEDIWGSSSPAEIDTTTDVDSGPVTVHHVADVYHKYPGELVTLHTRVDIHEDSADLTLRIAIPQGLILGDYRFLSMPELMPYTEVTEGANYLVWSIEGDLPAGTQYEYQTQARVAPTPWDIELESLAVVTNQNQDTLAQESVPLVISAKGRYLKYLPAIYEQDDLMGRLLMLFESFLAPIEQQIDNEHYYFDPRLTPTGMLHWLASWLDLSLDERWPEAKQRQLIRWAIALHRSRGTKWGLLKYLEIFTGQKAKIIEQRASNFILGSEARLGQGIALGRSNQPHTFSVTLRLPPIEADTQQEQERQERLRRRTIESIINMQKPAHTVYTLNLETALPEEETQPETETKKVTVEEETDEIASQAAIWFRLDDDIEQKDDDQPPADGNGKSPKRRGKKKS